MHVVLLLFDYYFSQSFNCRICCLNPNVKSILIVISVFLFFTERREDGSDCGSEVKQEPDNDQEQEQEAENEAEEIVCPFCTYQPMSKEELKQHLEEIGRAHV